MTNEYTPEINAALDARYAADQALNAASKALRSDPTNQELIAALNAARESFLAAQRELDCLGF